MTATAPRIPEKQVQGAVVRLYRQFGCTVNNLSQPRASMVAIGLPDLYVQCPRKRAAWWHEVKAADGELRPDQLDFLAREEACGRTVVVGGLEAAKAQLRRVGLIAGGIG